MKIELIKGSYSTQDTIDLISQLIHVKIKHLENQIEKTHNEEDIKMRESRIKQIQKEFYELKTALMKKDNMLTIESRIMVEA